MIQHTMVPEAWKEWGARESQQPFDLEGWAMTKLEGR
jgi:hypothetical protein